MRAIAVLLRPRRAARRLAEQERSIEVLVLTIADQARRAENAGIIPAPPRPAHLRVVK